MELKETKYTYIVTIKTGDYLGQSVNRDGRACLRFYDENGAEGRHHFLDRNAIFPRGSTNRVILKSTKKHMTHVEIWMEQTDKKTSQTWFLNLIQIRKKARAEPIYNYPFHRWITSTHATVQVNDSVLPQHDKFGQQRREEIHRQKEAYTMQCVAPWSIPILEGSVLYSERLDEEYFLTVIKNQALRNKVNRTMIPYFTQPWKNLADIINVFDRWIFHFPKPKICDFYMDIFTGKPDSDWKDLDRAFGAQRLTGTNPAVIRRVFLLQDVKDLIAVTDDMLMPHMEGKTIKEAIADQRLYMVDYTAILHNVPCNNGMTAAPIALFFVNHDDDLMPVAIQLFKNKCADNPVFLPSDGKYTWILAKLWFNNADAAYHQFVAHLGLTHLLLVAIYLALRQTVSVSHPLFRLMAPHFWYTLDMSRVAIERLLSKGGVVDRVYTMGVDGLHEIVRRRYTGSEGVQAWRLNVEGNILESIKERGVENLPNYHFRDDALKLHNAIRNYVKKVVEYHYTDPAILQDDSELQNWGVTMARKIDDGGCAIQGVPGNGRFTNVNQVIETVTSVITTGSVLHASVNFPQFEEYAYPLHYPAMLRGEPPRFKNPPHQESDVILTLPKMEMALEAMSSATLLSTNKTNSLGTFEIEYQFDQIGKDAVAEFRNELKEVGKWIDRRNNTLKQRAINKGSNHPELAEYTLLHPKNVPNATSI